VARRYNHEDTSIFYPSDQQAPPPSRWSTILSRWRMPSGRRDVSRPASADHANGGFPRPCGRDQSARRKSRTDGRAGEGWSAVPIFWPNSGPRCYCLSVIGLDGRLPVAIGIAPTGSSCFLQQTDRSSLRAFISIVVCYQCPVGRRTVGGFKLRSGSRPGSHAAGGHHQRRSLVRIGDQINASRRPARSPAKLAEARVRCRPLRGKRAVRNCAR
jgi:hypothetical protein